MISVKKNSIVIVGGTGPNDKALNSVAVISSNPFLRSHFPIPNFPKQIFGCSLFLQNGNLMLCGGINGNGSPNETCFQMKNGSWHQFKAFKNIDRYHSKEIVVTSKVTFAFGIEKVRYLPTGNNDWKVCENRIPGYFVNGCAIEIKSKGEIWLIGGVGGSSKGILSFNLDNHTFKELPMKLKIGRMCHKCIVTEIGNSEVILVTGGGEPYGYGNSVEIINIETGSVTLSPSMNIKRVNHGIGTLSVNNQPRIAVFGGDNGNHVENTMEIFDPETLKWEIVEDFKMNESRDSFGYLKF